MVVCGACLFSAAYASNYTKLKLIHDSLLVCGNLRFCQFLIKNQCNKKCNKWNMRRVSVLKILFASSFSDHIGVCVLLISMKRKEFGLREPLQLSMEEICRDIFLAYRQEKCHDKFFPFVYMF